MRPLLQSRKRAATNDGRRNSSAHRPDRGAGCEPRPETGKFADVRALTAAITRADEGAFNLFYTEYSPRIYRLLLVVTRGEQGLARELHQSVMIKVARKVKVFATDGELWAWLGTVARNEWRDACRRRSRDAKRSSNGELAPGAGMQEPRALLVESSGQVELLAEAMAQLSDAERELMECFYLEDCSQAELARRSGRTLKAIQCALARARAELRDLVREKAR